MVTNSFFKAGGAAFTSNSNEWQTPPALFRELDKVWHFDLDPASTDENALCKHHFTIEDDGLQQDWGGHRVFCNPPYGRLVGKWVEKAAKESRKPDTIMI